MSHIILTNNISTKRCEEILKQEDEFIFISDDLTIHEVVKGEIDEGFVIWDVRDKGPVCITQTFRHAQLIIEALQHFDPSTILEEKTCLSYI